MSEEIYLTRSEKYQFLRHITKGNNSGQTICEKMPLVVDGETKKMVGCTKVTFRSVVQNCKTRTVARITNFVC